MGMGNGEKKMNFQNAIRHSIAMLNKYNKNPTTENFNKSIESFNNIPINWPYNINYCNGCNADNFGYCYYRNINVNAENIFKLKCCYQIIKALETTLLREQWRKRSNVMLL